MSRFYNRDLRVVSSCLALEATELVSQPVTQMALSGMVSKIQNPSYPLYQPDFHRLNLIIFL